MLNTIQAIVIAHAQNAVVTKTNELRYYFTATTCNINILNTLLEKYKLVAAHMYTNQYIIAHTNSILMQDYNYTK